MQYRPPRSARKLTAEKTEKGEIINHVHKNWIFNQTANEDMALSLLSHNG
jgi:hypothetical protein